MTIFYKTATGKKLYGRPTHRVKWNGEKYYPLRRGVMVPRSQIKILK